MAQLFTLKEKYDAFIDGKFAPSVTGEYFSSINPATEETLTQVAYCSAEDVALAVAAAKRAFPAWAKMSGEDRQMIMMQIAQRIEDNLEELAYVETLDNGKPLDESREDIVGMIDQFRYFAACIRAREGKVVHYNDNSFSMLIHEPIGIVGQIVPWNFPLSTGGWKLAPALAAGNCIIFKPASNTSVSSLVLADILKDILPAGVLNVVTGSGGKVGNALTTHPDVLKISFTGSTEVGQQIGAAAGKKTIPATLELGGKSANIIFPDCQWERALVGSACGILLNSGQVCAAGSRLFVHSDIYDKFIEDLAAKFNKVKIGNGLDPETKMGPMIDKNQLDLVLEYVDIGLKEGARLVCGGHKPKGFDKGFYMEPTILADVDNSMRVAQEEIFGPVLVVIKFTTEEEVIAMANDSIYGLGGGVWTQNINRALRIAKNINTGTMWINEFGPTPSGSAFGGYKESGYNREVHQEIMNHYSQVKNIFINMDEEPTDLY